MNLPSEVEERWAEALAVERRYGDEAREHAATRITALVTAGDVAGFERWKAIALRLDQLTQAPEQ